jgi:hypothetical protein
MGMDLPVDICLADIIVIDQGDFPYPATRQTFHCPGAYSADTNNRDMHGTNLFRALYAVDPGDTTKTCCIFLACRMFSAHNGFP